MKSSERKGLKLEQIYGKEKADLIRKKYSEANKIRWNNPEFRKHMIIKLKTRKVYWGDKISKVTKGEKNPFYGKKHTRKTLIKLEKNNYSKRRGKTFEETYGGEKAAEMIKKFIKSNSGKKHHFYGKKFSQEHKKKLKKARAKQIIPVKDSSIEVKIQNFLKKLGIEFFTHQYIKINHGYQCDILIPSMNTVIECDGDWWHGNPLIYPNPNTMQKEQINEDRIRTMELIEKGFNVLRLWEHEIKVMELNDFRRRLNVME